MVKAETPAPVVASGESPVLEQIALFELPPVWGHQSDEKTTTIVRV